MTEIAGNDSNRTRTQLTVLVLEVEVLGPEDVPAFQAPICEHEFHLLRSKGPQRIEALRPDQVLDHLWLAG
jgi:hypothetical protein